ncbi:MAG TPA: acetate--CoA ligase family protein [Deltaproteobacteria bacterium]|nr:acetate--CoA ligase family protein [Deltaproteobacteria bacterium]
MDIASHAIHKSSEPSCNLFEEITARARAEGRTYLFEPECKKLLEDIGIATTGFAVAQTPEDAVRISDQIGYPVVLKIVSENVVHKSDSGGVKLNLNSAKEVRSACADMLVTFSDVTVRGISVQKMAQPGTEVIIGVTRDPIFGPVLMFGLGGIFVEVMKDVTFRILPVDEKEIDTMIREIQGYPLLKGYRGHNVDIRSLKTLLLKVSKLVMDHPHIRELDLNPVICYPDGYSVVDARIFVDSKVTSMITPAKTADLHDFFYPKSIAMIGASDTKGKLGWNVFHNLISRDCNARIYPINPKCDVIQGVKAYKSLAEIDDDIDVAIVLVPASATVSAVEECCRYGVRYIVIESAGFAELGEEGKRAQEEMKSVLKKYGARALGPNCSGVINTHHNMNQALGIVTDLGKGNVGLVAQAGVYASGILWGLRHVMDFGIVATIGNKLDINETDILNHLGDDDNIDVICMYLEDITSGRKFVEVAKEVTRKKPTIILKSGRTEAGKKAVMSHTASLAGDDTINDIAFRQSGVIRARDNDHMFDLARAFAKQPIPQGDGVLVITYTGSLGVAATDTMYLGGMRLGVLEPELQKRLKEILPGYVQSLNPVDYSFTMNAQELRKTIEIGVESKDIGSFIVVLQTEILDSFIKEMKEIDYKGKPIMTCVPCKEFAMDEVIRFEKLGFPVYSTPEMAAEALSVMYHYSCMRDTQFARVEHKMAS